MNLSQQTIDDIVWWGHRSTLFLTPHIGVLIGLKQSGSFQHSSPGKTFAMKVIRSRKAFCIVCWEYLQSTSKRFNPRAARLNSTDVICGHGELGPGGVLAHLGKASSDTVGEPPCVACHVPSSPTSAAWGLLKERAAQKSLRSLCTTLWKTTDQGIETIKMETSSLALDTSKQPAPRVETAPMTLNRGISTRQFLFFDTS